MKCANSGSRSPEPRERFCRRQTPERVECGEAFAVRSPSLQPGAPAGASLPSLTSFVPLRGPVQANLCEPVRD